MLAEANIRNIRIRSYWFLIVHLTVSTVSGLKIDGDFPQNYASGNTSFFECILFCAPWFSALL